MASATDGGGGGARFVDGGNLGGSMVEQVAGLPRRQVPSWRRKWRQVLAFSLQPVPNQAFSLQPASGTAYMFWPFDLS